MEDRQQPNSLRRRIDSAAYHEAGHAVVAARLGLEFWGGIHINCEGAGVSEYCHREPGIKGSTAKDIDERKRTIVALYAGKYAQEKYFPGLDYPESSKSDMDTAAALLEEMKDVRPRITDQMLRSHAERLVLDNWSVIDKLALTLLKKQTRPLTKSEIDRGWSLGRPNGKSIPRCELEDFFRTALAAPKAS